MSTREILQRLLRRDEPARRFCTIDSRTADGRYRVTDDQGRFLTVDGDPGYLPQAAVVVQSGRIVGIGRRYPVMKTYRV